MKIATLILFPFLLSAQVVFEKSVVVYPKHDLVLGIEQQYLPYLAGMNTWGCSDGSRLTTPQIDRLVKRAKRKLDELMIDRYGYLFCYDCKRSDKPLDRSHTISVKFAKETGRSELAFDVENLKHRCRDCHDKLDAKKNAEREDIYQRQRGSILR